MSTAVPAPPVLGAPQSITGTCPPETNGKLREIAAEHLFRTTRLEDDEQVIRIRGGARGKWPSDHPHAGIWGPETMYMLVPSSHPNSRALAACRQFPRLVDRTSEAEVLLLGSIEDIVMLMKKGPGWGRARKKKRVSPEDAVVMAERLRATRFVKSS
jgi:hypothetical protein